MPDLIDQWLELRDTCGLTTTSAAANRLGIRTATLERAILRAREAGDKRIPNLRDTRASAYDAITHSPTLDTPPHYADGQQADAAAYVRRKARDAMDATRLLDALGLEATP